MARQNGAAFTESIVFARDNAYPYRKNLGMLSSAEYLYEFEDFDGLIASNAPSGWSTIIDTGATLTTLVSTNEHGGIGRITSDAADEGVAIYRARSILLSGKRFFMECRVRGGSVTDNIIKFGLTDLTAVTNPEDIWTTTAANLVAFGINDGAATPVLVYDKANAGPVTQTASTAFNLTAATWVTLAISYNGSSAAATTGALQAWVNGTLALTASTPAQIPDTVVLAPFIGSIAGNGALQTMDIDYVRYSVQR